MWRDAPPSCLHPNIKVNSWIKVCCNRRPTGWLMSIHEPWKVCGSEEHIDGRLSGMHSSHDLAQVIFTTALVYMRTYIQITCWFVPLYWCITTRIICTEHCTLVFLRGNLILTYLFRHFLLQDVSFSDNVERHRQADGQTDNIMPIADQYMQYDRLKTVNICWRYGQKCSISQQYNRNITDH